MTDNTEEVDVELTTFDMDDLSEGQPVFKQGDGTRLVLRFEDFQDWHLVPKAELEALADEWREQRTGEYYTDKAFERAADRLEELITDRDLEDFTDE
jgi:hypothetical protein